jgi:hypothetical protein
VLQQSTGKATSSGSGPTRYASLAEHTKDSEKEVDEVLGGMMFMVECDDTGYDGEDDTITLDEDVQVNAAAIDPVAMRDDTCKHDTGATHHIFHDKALFRNYEEFDSPLIVKGFGLTLSTAAPGKGTIVLRTTHKGISQMFSISNVLHVPIAHCNLISGSRLDRKGVRTMMGNGKITYFSKEHGAFASGRIVSDLYQMDVVPVKAPSTAADGQTDSDIIAAMVPHIASLFGPGTETETARRLGFITV